MIQHIHRHGAQRQVVPFGRRRAKDPGRRWASWRAATTRTTSTWATPTWTTPTRAPATTWAAGPGTAAHATHPGRRCVFVSRAGFSETSKAPGARQAHAQVHRSRAAPRV